MTHGPLQDPDALTPFDLLFHGITIHEAVPNYYRFVHAGKNWALHDTPAQAIWHARRVFMIWGDL